MNIYISHGVEKRQDKDINRIGKILKNGILPAEWTGETNYPIIGMGEYTSNHKFSFFSVSDNPNISWNMGPEYMVSTIFLKKDYIKKNNESFFNGSIKGIDGRKIGYNNDPQDLTQNTKYFEEFCIQNKLMDYDYKTMSHASFRRLVNQLVAKVPILPEAFDKVIVFDEITADIAVKNKKFHVPLYFTLKAIDFNKLTRI